jgi:S1-C subfamily serine protease
VTAQLAEDLNLAADKGALVVEVTKDSPADKAGLRGGRTQTSQGVPAGGDLIVEVDGKAVSDSSEVASAISQKRPGDETEITYYRGDSKKTVTVELAKRPKSADQPSSDQGGGDGGGGLLP